jgi:hypothetical protein
VRQIACPVCSRTLAQPKSMPRDPIGWLAAQVHNDAANLDRRLDVPSWRSRDATRACER